VLPMYGIFLTNCLGQGEKIRWTRRWADYVCTCTFYLPAFLYAIGPFMPLDFKEQAGRTQGLHMCVPHTWADLTLKVSTSFRLMKYHISHQNHNALTRGS
jgi:hypothetical protein